MCKPSRYLEIDDRSALVVKKFILLTVLSRLGLTTTLTSSDFSASRRVNACNLLSTINKYAYIYNDIQLTNNKKCGTSYEVVQYNVLHKMVN